MTTDNFIDKTGVPELKRYFSNNQLITFNRFLIGNSTFSDMMVDDREKISTYLNNLSESEFNRLILEWF